MSSELPNPFSPLAPGAHLVSEWDELSAFSRAEAPEASRPVAMGVDRFVAWLSAPPTSAPTVPPEGMYRRWLPKHRYPAAADFGVLPCCDETGEVGCVLTMPDGTHTRFRISPADAARVLTSLLEDQARFGRKAIQSASSSGSPSVDGSTPPGQSV